MIRGPLSRFDYRGKFSGHETFPLRQLWLRKAFDAVRKHSGGASKRLFSDAGSIEYFGVGRNMVASIRHWALACGVIEDAGDAFVPTELGRFIFDEVDPFMESSATIWLLHWMIAGHTPPARTTTWFYAFNNHPSVNFDRASLVSSLQDLNESREHWTRASPTTIKRDVECFIRSYVLQSDARFLDESVETVLTELGLIQPLGTGFFQFRRGPKPSLPDGVFLFALNEFWQSHAPDQNTLSFESISFEPGSPGRTFKLDEYSLAKRLSRIDETSGNRYFWSESAGIRQVARREGSIERMDLLRLAYPAISRKMDVRS